MDKCKLLLEAAIYNNEREIEIYEWLAETVPQYGTKPFNKRFETWLNAESSKKFGTYEIENWGMNGESKTVPNVSFWFRKADYVISTVKYQLSFHYKGKEVSYDYDTKTTVLRDSNEREQLFGLADAQEVINWATNIPVNRRKEVIKAKNNIRALPKLFAVHDSLEAQITEFNDRVSYAISDELRIR